MLKGWEYLFYKFYYWHHSVLKNKSENRVISAIFGLSALLMANYVVLYEGISYLIMQHRTTSKWVYWVPLTIIIVTNLLYFRKTKKVDAIIERYTHISIRKKRNYNLLFMLYLVASIALLLMMIYLIRNNIRF